MTIRVAAVVPNSVSMLNVEYNVPRLAPPSAGCAFTTTASVTLAVVALSSARWTVLNVPTIMRVGGSGSDTNCAHNMSCVVVIGTVIAVLLVSAVVVDNVILRCSCRRTAWAVCSQPASNAGETMGDPVDAK